MSQNSCIRFLTELTNISSSKILSTFITIFVIGVVVKHTIDTRDKLYNVQLDFTNKIYKMENRINVLEKMLEVIDKRLNKKEKIRNNIK